MTLTKEQIQERAQLVRVHEANCAIEHPTPEELGFRMAIMKRIALEYQLKELRGASLLQTDQARPSNAPKKG